MKAWRFYDVGDMRLDDIPDPVAKPGWIVARVNVLQVSVTEVQQALGKQLGQEKDLRTRLKEETPLQLFGHEFCGSVVQIGAGVKTVKPGDRVFWSRCIPCHNCLVCNSGYEQNCNNVTGALGSDYPGCLAEYVAIPADSASVIPDSISDSEGAAMQPHASSVSDVASARIDPGDTIVITGQGVMGLNIMQISRVCGAGRVIGIDIRDEVLELSKKLGVDMTINASKIDPVEVVKEATKGRMADIVFECAGGSPDQGLSGAKTLTQALQLVREGGKIVQVAHLGPDVVAPLSKFANRHLEYIGFKFANRKLIDFAIDLVASRRVQLSPAISEVLQGIDKVPESFEKTGNKTRYGLINPAQVMVSTRR